MKREPYVKDSSSSYFYHNGNKYELIMFNDEDDEIPHFYLTDKDHTFYCGFESRDDNQLVYYTKEKHNKLIEDKDLLESLQKYLDSPANQFEHLHEYEFIRGMWESYYEMED